MGQLWDWMGLVFLFPKRNVWERSGFLYAFLTSSMAQGDTGGKTLVSWPRPPPR